MESWRPKLRRHGCRGCRGRASGWRPVQTVLPAAVRQGVAGALAVNNVRGDGQNRLSVQGISIGRVLSELVHERADQPRSQLVNSIVVVAKLGNSPSV